MFDKVRQTRKETILKQGQIARRVIDATGVIKRTVLPNRVNKANQSRVLPLVPNLGLNHKRGHVHTKTMSNGEEEMSEKKSKHI